MAFNRMTACAFFLATVAISCNGDVEKLLTPEADPGMQRREGAPQASRPPAGPPQRCRILIAEEDFSRVVSEKEGMIGSYFIAPGPLMTCLGTDKQKLTGYNMLHVYPPLELQADPQYVDGRIEVPIAAAELTDAFRQALADEFQLSEERLKAVILQRIGTENTHFESHAAAGSLPRLEFRVKQRDAETVLVMSRKKGIKEKRARAFIRSFEKGKTGIRLSYTARNLPPSQETRSWLLHSPRHRENNRNLRDSKLDLLKELWKRAEWVPADPGEQPEDIDDFADETPDQERDEILGIAYRWRYQLTRYPRAEVLETLAPMREYAARSWIPRSPTAHPETAHRDLTRMIFLGVFSGENEGEGPVARYYAQYLQLQHYFGYENPNASFALLREILAIVDDGSLTESQQMQVHSIAGSLMGPHEYLANFTLWQKAKDICQYFAFDTGKLKRFSRFMSALNWRSTEDWSDRVEQAKGLVSRREEISEENLLLLERTLSWLSGGMHYDETESPPLTGIPAVVSHAECLVFESGMDAKLLSKLQEAYRMHLALGLPPQQSLECSEREILPRSCMGAADRGSMP